MKKLAISVITIITLILLLPACGPLEKKNGAIMEDLLSANPVYEQYSLKGQALNIEKRQTNKDQKTDFIWCELITVNEDVEHHANYELEYVLYNDGWKLEQWKLTSFRYVPKVTPTEELALMALQPKYPGEWQCDGRTNQGDMSYTFHFYGWTSDSKQYLREVCSVDVKMVYSLGDGWIVSDILRTVMDVYLMEDALVGDWQGSFDVGSIWSKTVITFNLRILSINKDQITCRIGIDNSNSGVFSVGDTVYRRNLNYAQYEQGEGYRYHLHTSEPLAKSNVNRIGISFCSLYNEQPFFDYDSSGIYAETYSETIKLSRIDNEIGSNIVNASEIRITGAQASSALTEPQYGVTHWASRVLDGDLTTAWSEGVDGYGIGESITISFERACQISGFDIWNGYHKSSSTYSKNSRPSNITVSFSDGTSESFELRDVMEKQTITFDRPVDTTFMEITINSVYKGSDYSDTLISEIKIF